MNDTLSTSECPAAAADLAKAAELLHADRVGEAEHLCEQLVLRDPDDPGAYHLLGRIELRRGRFAKALRMITHALKIDSTCADYHCDFGNVQAAQGQYEPALRSYDDALRLDPRHVRALSNKGGVLMELRRGADARASFEAVIAIDPKNCDAWRNLGDSFTIDKDMDRAISCYRRALEIEPNHLGANANLAYAYLIAKRYAESFEHYRQALAQDWNQASLHEGLACLYARGGEIDKAKAATREAIRLRPLRSRARTGKELGSVLVLQSMEDAFFRFRNGSTSTQNTSNVVAVLANEKFELHRAYVDADFMTRVAERIPAVDLLFNGITEPDNCHVSLALAQEFSESRPCPIINRPAQVELTTRDNIYRRLGDHPELTFPRTVRRALGTDPAGDLRRIISTEGFHYPVIVRVAGTHTGKTVVKIDDDEMLAANAPAYAGRIVYVIQFKDCTIHDRFFSKLRFFVIDGELIPWNYLFGDEWIVHSAMRKSVMLPNPWMVEMEQKFLADPVGAIGRDHYDTLQGLHDIIGLDFYGIDFSVLDDGELVVFEVNAAVGYKRKWARTFPYLIGAIDRISGAVNDMVLGRLAQSKGS